MGGVDDSTGRAGVKADGAKEEQVVHLFTGVRALPLLSGHM